MQIERVELGGIPLTVYTLNTAIVGSGAAGLNAADRLHALGQRDIAIVTEGVTKGTSRNTGSDKQTYYKLTLAGGGQDSVRQMAETLAGGGAMHGDIALVEAALSAQCFYHLVDIGVPFPHDTYGQYVGYKTDHDPRQRATSAGPLTSKFMTERLLEQVQAKNIPIYAGYQVIKVLTDPQQRFCVGLLALNLERLEDPAQRYALFNCTNVVYATGGPAGLYAASVYPESQVGATGLALEAGAKGCNLTESQYGIASIKFRWNLSGTYQQVLPRYVSTDAEGGDEREFLTEYFASPGQMLDAIFLKGYQWPFDPRKVANQGSSLIDLLVYNETVLRGRRVFLDYTHNSNWASRHGKLGFDLLGPEGCQYLKRSGALFGRPIDRLAHMNQPAIELYRDHGIDLASDYLEVAVCAQHNNGGLGANIWWESNLGHFFPVGEVNGSHGVYRPGGSALNSGQVGSTRAAQYIAACCQRDPLPVRSVVEMTRDQIGEALGVEREVLRPKVSGVSPEDVLGQLQQLTTRVGGHIRSLSGAKEGAKWAEHCVKSLEARIAISQISQLPSVHHLRDLLITQYVYLTAIANYIEAGGGSRGSYLVQDPSGELPQPTLPESFRCSLDAGKLDRMVQEVFFTWSGCRCSWVDARPIPQDDGWFESVWNQFRRGQVVGAVK